MPNYEKPAQLVHVREGDKISVVVRTQGEKDICLVKYNVQMTEAYNIVSCMDFRYENDLTMKAASFTGVQITVKEDVNGGVPGLKFN
jgi:predicted DNA-binding antitoxin AbrB/MazE fold protein